MSKDNAKKDKDGKITFFRLKDILIVLGLLLVAGVLWLIFLRDRAQGGLAQVSIIGVEEVQQVPLNKNQIIDITGASLPVRLEVSNGSIRFINSVCPDHVCENVGWLTFEHDQAVCVPAGVVVAVQEASE